MSSYLEAKVSKKTESEEAVPLPPSPPSRLIGEVEETTITRKSIITEPTQPTTIEPLQSQITSQPITGGVHAASSTLLSRGRGFLSKTKTTEETVKSTIQISPPRASIIESEPIAPVQVSESVLVKEKIEQKYLKKKLIKIIN